MATLKQHQAAMVNLLANGTAIPTSAVRLAHALHDVLSHINGAENAPEAHTERRSDATTSGLNDAALAYDMAAVKPKRSSAEQQIAMLNNTIRQLRESNKDLRDKLGGARLRLDAAEHEIECVRIAFDPDYVVPEQAGCRKDDTQCQHRFNFASPLICVDCGADRPHSNVEPGDDSWDTDRRPGGDGVGVGE